MTGLVALDIIIGLVFIYLIYSLFATLIQEIIAVQFGFRAKTLQMAIVRMLQDENTKSGFIQRLLGYVFLFVTRVKRLKNDSISKEFYNHPSIKYLAQDRWHSKPSYIASRNFSKVIIDLLKGLDTDLKAGDDIRGYVEKAINAKEFQTEDGTIPIDKYTHKHLKSLWLESQGDLEKFKFLLERWFDETMERTTEWYKQHTQLILFIVGLCIAAIFNVNTFEIVTKLSKDPELREQLVTQAETFAKEHPNLEQEYKFHKTQLKVGNDDSLRNTYNHLLIKKNGIEERLNALLQDTLDQTGNIEITKKAKRDSIIALDSQLSKLKPQISTSDSLESLIKARDALTKQASDMVKNDISKINNLLGLGWPDVPDSLDLKPIDSLTAVKKKVGYSYLRIDLAEIKTKDSAMLLVYPTLLGTQILGYLKQDCKTPRYKNFNKALTKIDFHRGSYLWCFFWGSFSGWFITALAISLGAPFWFELLNKLIKMRGAVKPQETKEYTPAPSKVNTVAPDQIHG